MREEDRAREERFLQFKAEEARKEREHEYQMFQLMLGALQQPGQQPQQECFQQWQYNSN